MRFWLMSLMATVAVSSCAANTQQQPQSRLHGNWQCSSTTSNASNGITVNINYTHRINTQTLKSTTETAMLITQKAEDNSLKRVQLLFDSAENIAITDNTISYSPYSANLISIERDELNMLATQASKNSLLRTIQEPASASYHFEGRQLQLYFPKSDMNVDCNPKG
ncbi:hypothetical protein P886_2176 [Alteromonadaceae bacterium 2753L.S.0a.02]|nr:hypothetical protein P886_2176 [Alteromonadaceae bacterium 2753L.S.0a.02]